MQITSKALATMTCSTATFGISNETLVAQIQHWCSSFGQCEHGLVWRIACSGWFCWLDMVQRAMESNGRFCVSRLLGSVAGLGGF